MSSNEATHSAAVETARNYYNSEDADTFYSQVWGGEDIHIGLYADTDEPISIASQRTVITMAKSLPQLDVNSYILDIGSGYCGAARYLARTYGAKISALNLSEVENQRARELNVAAGLAENIDVTDGSFEQIPFATASASEPGFDILWSQDAILHSDKREQVLAEAFRVLKPGGYFVFTDPMQADDCLAGVLQPILDRIHLSSLGSPGFYRTTAEKLGFEVVEFNDQTSQLINHYQRVLEETEKYTAELERKIDPQYVARMKAGLMHWIEGGKAGHLAWGIFLMRKS